MPFSDDDLKRLKEAVTKVDAEIGSTDRYMNTMLKAGNIAALLTRLESAEKVIKAAQPGMDFLLRKTSMLNSLTELPPYEKAMDDWLECKGCG
jgi:hypothetical protein